MANEDVTPIISGGECPRSIACQLLKIMKKPMRRRKKRTLGQQVSHILRDRMLSGLLVVVPVGITIIVVRFLYDFTAGRLTPILKRFFGYIPDYLVPVLAVFILIAGFYLLGLLTSAVLGRRLIALAEAIITRIPLVKNVYGGSKQVVDTLFQADSAQNFESVVIVDFPRPGMKALAFVTGTVEVSGEGKHYKLFVPTTPNPTSGYFEIAAPANVVRLDISVEDAVKFIVSGGLLAPAGFSLAKSAGDREA